MKPDLYTNHRGETVMTLAVFKQLRASAVAKQPRNKNRRSRRHK